MSSSYRLTKNATLPRPYNFLIAKSAKENRKFFLFFYFEFLAAWRYKKYKKSWQRRVLFL
jgi:hypothetical protein